MALVIKDRVKETTTTTGTDNLQLAGAASGFQGFVAAGITDTTYYALTDANGTAWEVGLGTITDGDPDTLTRTNENVIASTNSNNRISLSSGTHTVFATYPADKAVYLDANNILNASINNLSDCLVEDSSIYLGNDPSSTTSTAERNIAIGSTALDAVTTSDDNIAIGYNAGTTITGGASSVHQSSKNVLIGSYAGENLTTGSSENVFIGYEAGHGLVDTHTKSVVVGYHAGYSSSDDRSSYASNVSLGFQAGMEGNCQYSVHIGPQAGEYNAGNASVAIGDGALKGTSGTPIDTYDTTAIGAGAGSASTGDICVYLGHDAGKSNTTNNMLFIGIAAPTSDGTIIKADMAEKHLAIGMADDLFTNSDGDATLQIYPKGAADKAIYAKMADGHSGNLIEIENYSGTDIFVINSSGQVSTGTWQGTAIAQAYIANDAINGDKIADDAVDSEHYAAGSIDEEHLNATNSPTDNYLLSYDDSSGGFTWVAASSGGASDINDLSDCLVENNSIFLGNDPSSTTNSAQHNTAVGVTALDSITEGDYNVAIGNLALDDLTVGHSNVAIGYKAGDGMTEDDYNVYIGYEAAESTASIAGNSNVKIGYRAGKLAHTDISVFIGANAGQYIGDSSNKETYVIGIGANAMSGQNDSNVLDNYGSTGLGQAAGGHVGHGASSHYCLYLGFEAGYQAADADNMLYIANDEPSTTGAGGTIIKADMEEKHLAIGQADLLTNSAGDGTLQVYPYEEADDAFYAKMAGTHTGNLIQIQNSGGTDIFVVNSSGQVSTGTWQGTAIAQAYIANDAINGDKIADDAVDSEHYAAGSIDEEHLNATNTPTDNYILSYDDASGGFTWVAAGAGETNQNAFSTVAVSGQDNVAAESATDTLNLAAGSNITITTTAGTDTVTIAATDTNTTYSAATSSALGLVKIEDDTEQSVAANAVSATASRTYGIQLNSSNQAVVNVPWTDTNTTYSAATSSALGLMKLEDDTEQTVAANTVSATAGRTYGIQFNSSNQAVVNVPWTDTDNNTTYTGGTNLTLAGTTFNVDDAFLVNDADDTTTGTITAGGFTTAGTLTVDSVGISTIQSSGESFADNDTSLMTSAAIDDRINSAVANEDTLAELNDTNISSAAAGHLIIYDNTASVWDNAALSAGSNISITSEDGAITIAATDTNTTYTGGTNLTLAGTTFNVDDAFLVNNADDTTTGTITAGGFTTTGTWTFDTSAGGTTGITSINVGSAFTDDDVTLMSAGAIKEKIESYNYLTAHPSISAASSSDNSGRTYIQDITVDSNGHVTGIATATETVTDTNTTYTGGTNLTLAGTTFNVDDAFLKNDADDTTSGTVTMANLIVGNGGNVGSASVNDAITIAAEGDVTFKNATKPAAPAAASGTSGIVVLNCDTTNHFTITTTGDITGWNFTNASPGQRIIVRVTNGASHTVGFSATGDGDVIRFPGGTTPTLTTSGGIDVYGFLCIAADDFDGFIIGQALA